MNKKRKLLDEDSLEQSDEPPIKKLKLDIQQPEEKKELSLITATIDCEEFLCMITSEDQEFVFVITSDEQHQKLCTIQNLILKCERYADYDQVFQKYLTQDKFETIMPNLIKIELPSNFLFSHYGPVKHSKLKHITLTDPTKVTYMDSLKSLMVNYPSLESLHCYCYSFWLYEDSKETYLQNENHNLNKIILYSHLPSSVSKENNPTLSKINNKYNLKLCHKSLEIVEPRETLSEYCTKDFRHVYCGESDCINKRDHISVVGSSRCPWCRIFDDPYKPVAEDPDEVIIKNGIKYEKITSHDGYSDTEEIYLLRFPINQFPGDEYFDGQMFWSGMPDEPEPEFAFEDTILFNKYPGKYKTNTEYYLTEEECALLRCSSDSLLQNL